jgi:hypothetical protein
MIISQVSFGQDALNPQITCGIPSEIIKIDGLLNESSWNAADSISNLTMVEPRENQNASFKTVVKILADSKSLIFGIICNDDEPDKIVSFSKARDSDLKNEDHIKLILDTYLDSRNGFIFSINPMAARYDALASDQKEQENPNWDGIWEAKTHRGSNFWSIEIKIPSNSLTFKKGLHTWGFNIERRIQRFLEVDRWSGISRDYKVEQPFHAGSLNGIPQFNTGF